MTAVWSGETQTGTIAIIREVLAPIVVGADPFDSEWIFRRLERAAFGNSFARRPWRWRCSTCKDRSSDVPVFKLLGGRDRPPIVGEPSQRLQFVIGSDRGCASSS